LTADKLGPTLRLVWCVVWITKHRTKEDMFFSGESSCG